MSPNGVPAAGVGAWSAGAPQLTARELEVLRLLGDGRSTAQIAAALAVSTNTVRGHVRTLLRKLAVVGRDDAVRRACELGLLPRPDPDAAGAPLGPAPRWPAGDGVEAASVTGEGKPADRRIAPRVAAMRPAGAVRTEYAVRVL